MPDVQPGQVSNPRFARFHQLLTISCNFWSIRGGLGGRALCISFYGRSIGMDKVAQLDEQDFSGKNLEGLDLKGRTVRQANFDNTLLRNANFKGTTFLDCSFRGALLEKADLRRAVFENCDFTDANLVAVDAKETVFRSARVLSYKGAKRKEIEFSTSGSSFQGAVIERSTFAGARLTNAVLSNVKAENVDFRGANLQGARFDSCKIAGSDFAGAKLQGADFSTTDDARESLPEWALAIVSMLRTIEPSDLRNMLAAHDAWLKSDGRKGERAILRAVDLSGAVLDKRDLSGGDLRDSRLDNASMVESRLVATDMRGTSMIGTDLSRADLREALIDAEALAQAHAVGIRR